MEWFNAFMNGLPAVVQALLLLILALAAASICSGIAKNIVARFFKKNEDKTPEDVKLTSADTIELAGKLVYAVVFFLFLPGALDKLGMNSVTSPITTTVTKFLSILPNIIAAIILIGFGSFLAKLSSQIIHSLLKRTKLDELQQKAKIQAKEGSAFSDIISKAVYALILVVFVIAGVQVLGITAISEPATAMVWSVFNFIPGLFAAIILISFGIFLANLVGGLLESILSGTGIDRFSRDTYQNGDEKAMPASKIISSAVVVVIDIIFVVSGVKILGIEVLTNVGNVIIQYMPSVLAACLVLLVAWAVASWAQMAIVRTYPKASGMALLARIVIMVLASFMAISQLGISAAIIETLFKWMCIAFAAAFALAFGIGGKNWAADRLDKLQKKADEQLMSSLNEINAADKKEDRKEDRKSFGKK